MAMMFWPPRKPGGQRFEPSPRFVCLPCGKALFGPIITHFDILSGKECDVCAAPDQIVDAAIFLNHGEQGSRC